MKFVLVMSSLLFFNACSSTSQQCELHKSPCCNKQQTLEQSASQDMESEYPGRIPHKVFKNNNN
jgi:hypothetical protein